MTKPYNTLLRELYLVTQAIAEQPDFDLRQDGFATGRCCRAWPRGRNGLRGFRVVVSCWASMIDVETRGQNG